MVNETNGVAIGTRQQNNYTCFEFAVRNIKEYVSLIDWEIVTCGECRKMMTQDCLMCSFSPEGFCTGGPDDDQFCSFGVRR